MLQDRAERFFAVLAAARAFPLALAAQLTTALISGTITGRSGAVLREAQVTARGKLDGPRHPGSG
ncbi:MAG TPA: hypothetical protein VKV15_09920 [Bryobacteraceae bacterium]|nr:hypothetical protein [Bryobacteraceae bacterium]